MNLYVNKTQKLKEQKSTAITFTLVAIFGFIFVALLYFDLLPIYLSNDNRVYTSVVMCIMLFAFLAIGIASFASLKKIKVEAKEQKETEDSIIENIISQYGDKLAASLPKGQPESDEYADDYLALNQEIDDLLKIQVPNIEDAFREHLAESILEQIILSRGTSSD